MVTLNIKYKGSSLSVPNIGSIRGIDSKVDGKGGPIDYPPPPPASFDVTVFSSRPLGLMQVKMLLVEDDVVLSLKSIREQKLSAKDFWCCSQSLPATEALARCVQQQVVFLVCAGQSHKNSFQLLTVGVVLDSSRSGTF